MNSEDLKTECLAWLRYLRRCDIVCTEVGKYASDVWGLTAVRLIEIETKISLSDLKADFKKHKHQLYNRYAIEEGHRSQIPNSFYFAMPEDLVEKAKAFLATVELPIAKKYGIIRIENPEQWVGGTTLGRSAAVIIKAGVLHSQPPNPHTREVALMRSASELCGARAALSLHRRTLAAGLESLTSVTNSLYTRERQQMVPELEEQE